MDTPEDSLHQPHNKLFTVTFSNPENTAAFLKTQLTSPIATAIDWSSLKTEPNQFVDSHFKHSEADLLFSVLIQGKHAKIHILFEHQSTKDPHIIVRVLRYMTRIWEAILKDKPDTEKLPAILPVVLSQNGEVWHVPERLSDILDLPDALRPHLSPYIPDFQYHHLQLAEMAYDAITGTAAGIYALRVMKALKLDQLLTDPIWDQALIAKVPLDHFLIVMRYILATDIDKEGFKSRIININEAETSTAAMTLAEQLIQEGRQEGHQQGHQQGRQIGRQEGELTLTVRLLKKKFPAIAHQAEPAIRQLEEERLLSFGEALLFMNSSDDCLTWLGLK